MSYVVLLLASGCVGGSTEAEPTLQVTPAAPAANVDTKQTGFKLPERAPTDNEGGLSAQGGEAEGDAKVDPSDAERPDVWPPVSVPQGQRPGGARFEGVSRLSLIHI